MSDFHSDKMLPTILK